MDERIRALAADMLETMHAANGIGLAAQQVGAALQLTVLDISQVEDRPSTMKLNGIEVDPVERDASRLAQSENSIWMTRSLPAPKVVSVFPTSPPRSIARFPSRWKRRLSREKRSGSKRPGLLARALQHEVDHLNGILFIDRMSSVTKASLSSRLKRLQKETLKG